MSETVNEKIYELRDLQSKDLFLMLKLLNKIGMKELKKVFESDSVRDKIKNLKGKGSTDDESNGEVSKDQMASVVGISVAIEIGGIILENIPLCENEIYTMLSALTGMKLKALQEVKPAVFAEMILDVVHKEEFKDFFKVVSKSFK